MTKDNFGSEEEFFRLHNNDDTSVNGLYNTIYWFPSIKFAIITKQKEGKDNV